MRASPFPREEGQREPMYRPTGYNILGHSRLMADAIRTDAYAQALRRSIRPGCTVLDIGAGAGIFALLACQYGAGRVFAVETDNAIWLARELAATNGFAGRITFIQELATAITLPQRADVIVQDVHGLLPLYQHLVPTLIDARTRHLAPEGVLIPAQDTIWLAPVEAPGLYRHHAGPWDQRLYGLDWQPALEMALNAPAKGRVQPEQMLAQPQLWTVLDYMTIAGPDVAGDLQFVIQRGGTVHGLIAWFDSLLVEDVRFSNAPWESEMVYGQTFLPWRRPVEVTTGDRVAVTLQASLTGHDYVWTWSTRVWTQGQPGRLRASFEQSSYFAVPRPPLIDRAVP